MRGVRKVTAKAMKVPWTPRASVTAFLTCDVTPTMDLVARLRADRRFKGLRVSPLTIWCKAVCLAMGRTPVVNARWDDAADQIVFRDQINLGIAAATPRGLMVPVSAQRPGHDDASSWPRRSPASSPSAKEGSSSPPTTPTAPSRSPMLGCLALTQGLGRQPHRIGESSFSDDRSTSVGRRDR
ncbi:hypothetical protein JCM18916A_03770 [Cutibacterium acnes subsp. acnes]